MGTGRVKQGAGKGPIHYIIILITNAGMRKASRSRGDCC